MKPEQKTEKPSEHHKGNKAAMDAPQEEFIADQGVPSRPAATDTVEGDEVSRAKARNEARGHTHSGDQ